MPGSVVEQHEAEVRVAECPNHPNTQDRFFVRYGGKCPCGWVPIWPEPETEGQYQQRLLRDQRDTVGLQWKTEWAKIEQLSRTCVFCDFVAKSRVGLKTHLRKQH